MDFPIGAQPHKSKHRHTDLRIDSRQVAKGKATAESAGLREAMVECLRAAVTGVPGGGREGSRTACGVQPCAVC